MKNLLEIENVSLTYHSKKTETTAIKGLSFSVLKGSFTSIIGPSGCGKTSILSLISGLIPKSGGTVKLNGKEVLKPSDEIGYMLQKDQLFPWLTIEKNILLPLKIKKKLTIDSRNHVLSLAQKYGIGDFLGYYPSQLSGGMRQRVALIRTLASSPELLLLDEPFSALDYQTRLSVCDDVHRIIKSENKTAILVTHDISEAISLSDKIVVLSSRPARLKKEYYLDFDKSLSPLGRREDHRFGKWFEVLWKELN